MMLESNVMFFVFVVYTYISFSFIGIRKRQTKSKNINHHQLSLPLILIALLFELAITEISIMCSNFYSTCVYKFSELIRT